MAGASRWAWVSATRRPSPVHSFVVLMTMAAPPPIAAPPRGRVAGYPSAPDLPGSSRRGSEPPGHAGSGERRHLEHRPAQQLGV